MKRINSLSDLLLEELADLLSAENQLIEALPKMAEACQSLTLRLVLEAHVEVTKSHADRLKDIFSNILQNPQRLICKAIKKLIVESEDIISKAEKSQDREAAIIRLAQRVEQYEITWYQTACEHAIELHHTKIVELLNKTLNEERSMNLHLNELAQGMINAEARGFYIPEGKFSRGGIKKKSKSKDFPR
jgi:ferritin-like metal-binding protein YciE